MKNAQPTPKVTAYSLGVAIATLICAALPGAETVELQGAISLICGFALAWVIPER